MRGGARNALVPRRAVPGIHASNRCRSTKNPVCTDTLWTDRFPVTRDVNPIRRAARLGVALLALATVWPVVAQPKLKAYETPYYVLYTDLDAEGVQEAVLRITLMAEEYHRRTKGLAGTIQSRLPFYLFAHRRDYVAAGGLPTSTGVFMGDRLMAVANPSNPDATWHTVQHEGFHQFVRAAIGEGIPIWANEGLAEYFGHGVFTGDQFITGLIPAGRLARVKAALHEGKFRSLREMMLVPPELWSSELASANYDQAWSMVHFLAHGDNGKYQAAFICFLKDVSRKVEWESAWQRAFGRDVNAFEARWKKYWIGLPENPTLDLYTEATLSTLTSFYARAFSQRQKFETVDEFFEAARAGRLKAHHKDWLPPRLLQQALDRAPLVGNWSLERKTGRLLLVCETRSSAVLEGRFKIANGRVKSVTIKAQRRRR